MPDLRQVALHLSSGLVRRLDRKMPAAGAPAAILVCAGGGLGNTVLLLPLMQTLRRACPGARIDLMLESRAAVEFAEAVGLADRIVLAAGDTWLGGFRSFFWFAGALRRRRYDWVLRTFLCAPDMTRASLAAALTGAPVRVAFGTPQANTFETHVLRDDETLPEGDRHLLLATTLGVPTTPVTLPLKAPAAGRAWAEEYLDRVGLEPGQRLFGFHPGSDPRFVAKRWPAERFGTLMALCAERMQARVVLFGGPDDAAALDAAARASGAEVLRADRQNLAASMGLMERCAAFITNDSGLMHLASVLGVPTLAIFGPTDPVKNRPLGRSVRIVRLGIECSPCPKDYAISICPHHDCLNRLDVDVVYAALAESLEARDDRRSRTGS